MLWMWLYLARKKRMNFGTVCCSFLGPSGALLNLLKTMNSFLVQYQRAALLQALPCIVWDMEKELICEKMDCGYDTSSLDVGQAILFLELYLPYTGAFVFFPFLAELSLTVITDLTLCRAVFLFPKTKQYLFFILHDWLTQILRNSLNKWNALQNYSASLKSSCVHVLKLKIIIANLEWPS